MTDDINILLSVLSNISSALSLLMMNNIDILWRNSAVWNVSEEEISGYRNVDMASIWAQ